MKFAYWNGQIILREKVVIPLDDPAFQYGEGVFTTVRIKNGDPCFFNSHLERLQNQSLILGFPLPQIDRKQISDLILLNHASVGNFRLKLIRSKRQEIAFLDPFTPLEGEPCALKVEQTPHFLSGSVLKSLAYLERKRARENAQAEGFCDAILTCPQKLWLETGSGNLFWRENGTFFYPSQTNYYLKGVILSHLIEKMKMEPALQNPSQIAQLYFCNSLHGVRPIVQVDNNFYSRNFDLEKEWLLLVN
jgi:4-amino-4-deoxychorismate lyase